MTARVQQARKQRETEREEGNSQNRNEMAKSFCRNAWMQRAKDLHSKSIEIFKRSVK